MLPIALKPNPSQYQYKCIPLLVIQVQYFFSNPQTLRKKDMHIFLYFTLISSSINL